MYWNRTAAAAAVWCGCWLMGCSSEKQARKEPADQQVAGLERGRYLVEGVMACFACHGEVDWQAPGAPPRAGFKGAGAVFPEEGIPFKVVAPNITPDPETGLGRWSDAEIGRAIRDGIGRDGRILFPVMPYRNYRVLSDSDLAAVIAYLRSLPPVKNSPGQSEIPPPVRASLKAPPPVESVPAPDWRDPVQRGAYYVRLGDCDSCHTPRRPDMAPIAELAYAGGFLMKGPWGEVTSANITPDASGISYYDEATFLAVIRTGRVQARSLNNIMLWGYFRQMTDEDLKAMFAYLRTLQPVAHRVDNTEKPSPCRRCGGRHGLGAENL